MMGYEALLLALLAGCQASSDAGSVDIDAIRGEIDEQLQLGASATRTEDIEAYMDGLPTDFTIHDESGEVISREQQRAYIHRDWAVIPETIDLQVGIDSLTVFGDSLATVYTWQRWERLMLRPDRPGTDSVLTTQRHKENWRPTHDGWRLYEVNELGGQIWVNGEPYPR